MNNMELEKVKEQAMAIVMCESSDFIVISHEHLSGDTWEIMARSEVTGKHYIFKNDGSEFYDFREKH